MKLPDSVALLGGGLDLTFESKGKVYEMELRGLALSASPDRRTLWLWPRPKKPTRVSVSEFPRAAELRRAWSQLKPDEVLVARPRLGKSVVKLGRVLSIGYRSDKWTGTNDDYQHNFSAPPILERSGQVLRLRGGKLRVTPDGIRG